jgi:tetratricopeptide repeat protein 8
LLALLGYVSILTLSAAFSVFQTASAFIAISTLPSALFSRSLRRNMPSLFMQVYEGIGETVKSMAQYKVLLRLDATNVEAIASMAANFFYTDNPEKALLL